MRLSATTSAKEALLPIGLARVVVDRWTTKSDSWMPELLEKVPPSTAAPKPSDRLISSRLVLPDVYISALVMTTLTAGEADSAA